MATSRKRKKKNPIFDVVSPDIDPDLLPHINNPNANITPDLAGDVRRSMSTAATKGGGNSDLGGRWTFSPNGSPIFVTNTPNDNVSTSGHRISSNDGGGASAPAVLSEYAWGGTNHPDETKRGTGDQVYMGVIHDEPGDHIGPRDPDVDRVIKLDQAKDDVFSWSEHRLFALGRQLYKSGLIEDPNDRAAIYAVWNGAVTLAGKYYAAGKKLTPWDVMQLKGFHVDGTGSGGKGSPYANQTLSETHKNTSYIDGATADAYTSSIFQETLGRNPTDAELSKYRVLITGYEKKHPQITKTTTKYDEHGAARDSTSETIQNPDEVGLRQEEREAAKADPEYGAYQAATTYYNAIQDLINGR